MIHIIIRGAKRVGGRRAGNMHYLLSILGWRHYGHLSIVRTRIVLGVKLAPATFATHGEERGALSTVIDGGAIASVNTRKAPITVTEDGFVGVEKSLGIGNGRNH